MPISSSVKPLLQARHLWLSFLFLLAPLFFYGQSLTGLWTGALHNDSSSVRKDQSFEIALTEYKGKVFGYSRSEFIVNDTLYYIVKRVKGVIEGDICEVKDDEIIAYNFRGKLDKGIKVTSTFRRSQTDSTWRLDGEWKTNATKKYYSVTGKVKLAEEKDLTASKLFPHLEELNKADEMVFYKERNETAPIVKVAKPDRIESEYVEKADILVKNEEKSLPVKKPELPLPVQPTPPELAVKNPEPTQKQEKPEEAVVTKHVTVQKQDKQIAPEPVKTAEIAQKTENSPINPSNPVKNAPETVKNDQPNSITPPVNSVVVVNTGASEKLPTPAAGNQAVKTSPVQTEKAVVKTTVPATKPNQPAETLKQTPSPKTPEKKPAPVTPDNLAKSSPVSSPGISQQPVIAEQALTPVTSKTVVGNPVASNLPRTRLIDPAALLVKKSVEDPIKKSTMIAGRKSEFSQEVYFKSDSLILTLYDNGEIDGDTVSVFLNGDIIMPSQGLKSSAIRKTIHMDDGLETFTLVMFAESLGKYPPNTGLLVIRDGNDVYNLRFSSDFQKSSGIVFRRKAN